MSAVNPSDPASRIRRRALGIAPLVALVLLAGCLAAATTGTGAELLATGGGQPPAIHDARMWERTDGTVREWVLPITSTTSTTTRPTTPPTSPTAVPATPTTTAPTTTTTAAPPAPASGDVVLGVTHTDRSLEPWHDAGAVAQAESLLRSHPGTFQNVHLMGWGTLNPEPRPGQFDWTTLDRRIDLVRRTGGIPVITLCCSPDWMKGGSEGATDWSTLEVAPRPEHFADFAELARQVALRYPDVRHFLVWNEMKGFFDSSRNRWRYEDYTDLYNQVYDALKSVDPDIHVGGPYVVATTWQEGTASHPSALRGPWGVFDQRSLDVLEYWMANAHGFDFVTVDAAGPVRGGGWTTDPLSSQQKFAALGAWIRARTDVPIWWAELYPIRYEDASGFAVEQQTALWDAALDAVAAGSGPGSVVLLWQPESRDGAAWQGLWTDTRNPGGGRATVLCTAICDRMGPGS